MGWDTSQYATYNIPVGSSLGSCYGMYNTYFVSNTGWVGGNSNHSLCAWLNTYTTAGALNAPPFVYNMNGKNSNSQSNLSTSFVRYEDRRFYFSVNSPTTSQGGVVSGSPMQQGGSSTSFIPGYNMNCMSNDQTYISIKALPAYGYGFMSWRYNTVSGAVWNTVAATNVYHNSANIMNGAVQHFWATFFFNMSDKRLKTNIRQIGKSKSGINIYTWNYKYPGKHGYGLFEGVIAQEVPQATIVNSEGYLLVDYSKTDVIFKKLSNGSR